MFKYVKYNKVQTEYTVLNFKGGTENLIVTEFSGIDENIVSISCDDEDVIDTLIDSQDSEINCEVIEKDDFKTYVKYSDQINRIRQRVKNKIAIKYDIADEIAISKLDNDNDKKKTYQNYVDECIDFGSKLKEEIGY